MADQRGSLAFVFGVLLLTSAAAFAAADEPASVGAPTRLVVFEDFTRFT